MPTNKTTNSQSNMAAKIAQLREKMEEIVKNNGYCIQGVGGSDENLPYVYTFGRNDAGKPDIYIHSAPPSLAKLVQECVDIIDQNEFQDGGIYESKTYVLAKDETTPTKFILNFVDPVSLRDITLGIFNRGKPIEDIRIVKVTLADENNQFPGVCDDRQ